MSIIESRLPVVLDCDSILAGYYYLLIPSLVIL
jgi:hypothetical protein